MNTSIEVLIATVREFVLTDKKVNLFNPDYVIFKDTLTEFIFENQLDEEQEWKKIQENLVWKTNQYMTSSEANVIIVELEKIKQKLLKFTYKQSYDIWNLIHPRISAISKQKFYDRHYSDAVRSAFVEINARLKKIYKNQRNEEKDGVDLMRKAFNPNGSPLLLFEEITTESGRNVQEGYMQIFAGCIQGIRNPASHENTKITEGDAIKHLVLAGLLMDKIDEALKFTKIKEESQ